MEMPARPAVVEWSLPFLLPTYEEWTLTLTDWPLHVIAETERADKYP